MHNQGILFEEEIKIQPLIEPFSPLGEQEDALESSREMNWFVSVLLFRRDSCEEIWDYRRFRRYGFRTFSQYFPPFPTQHHLTYHFNYWRSQYLLTRRALCSLACPPEAIVFFRDGVSEAEVSAVLNRGSSTFLSHSLLHVTECLRPFRGTEVSAVRQAFDRFKRVYLDSTSQEYRDLLDSVVRKFGQDQARRDQTMQAFQSAAQALKPKVSALVLFIFARSKFDDLALNRSLS